MELDSVYKRLGEATIKILVDLFYTNVMKDDRISHLFKTDIVEVKRKQEMFLTQFFGGPGLYSNEFGHPRMRMRHMPHAISPSAAIAWLECMKFAIVDLKIDESLKIEIFNKFQKLAAHMVNRPD